MNLIIIFTLCLLATSKVTLQGFFAKKNIKTTADGIFFNGLIFLFSALVFLKNIFPFQISVALFGAAFGILTVVFQLCYIKAMSCGNVSLTVLIINLSMIIPITVSLVFFNETLSFLGFMGILLTVLSLLLTVNKNEKSPTFKKWMILSLFASLANGALAVCQQFFGKTEWKSNSQGFVAWSYITAAVISALLYLIFSSRGKSITFKIKPSVFGFGLAVGVILGIFQFINTKAVATIDGTLLFPSYYGGSVILSAISSVLILKDKLTQKQKISIFIGAVAIVLMNI